MMVFYCMLSRLKLNLFYGFCQGKAGGICCFQHEAIPYSFLTFSGNLQDKNLSC